VLGERLTSRGRAVHERARDARPAAGVEKGARGLYHRAFAGGPALQGHAVATLPLEEPAARAAFIIQRKSQMPKLKTKSGAKKRFKLSASGKVIAGQTRKRHGMIKRTKKQIRQLRGTRAVSEADSRAVRKYYLPYG
jgi:large subunit ribosomal protein L35